MNKVCWIVCISCMALTIGLVVGVENGQPLANLVWCIPLMAVSLVTGFIARG